MSTTMSHDLKINQNETSSTRNTYFFQKHTITNSTFLIKILHPLTEIDQDASTFLQSLNEKNDKLDFEYEISEDPMQQLSGEDAENMINLLSKRSPKNQIDVLKNAIFEKNSATFKLDIKFKKE